MQVPLWRYKSGQEETPEMEKVDKRIRQHQHNLHFIVWTQWSEGYVGYEQVSMTCDSPQPQEILEHSWEADGSSMASVISEQVHHLVLVIHGFHMLSGIWGLFEYHFLSSPSNEHQMD